VVNFFGSKWINWAYIVFLAIIALFTGVTGEELGWRGILKP